MRLICGFLGLYSSTLVLVFLALYVLTGENIFMVFLGIPNGFIFGTAIGMILQTKVKSLYLNKLYENRQLVMIWVGVLFVLLVHEKYFAAWMYAMGNFFTYVLVEDLLAKLTKERLNSKKS